MLLGMAICMVAAGRLTVGGGSVLPHHKADLVAALLLLCFSCLVLGVFLQGVGGAGCTG